MPRYAEIAPEKIKVENQRRRDLKNIDSLANSIYEVGLLHPVVITPKKVLILGHRRLAAMKKLGCKSIPCTIVKNLDDALKLLSAERDENTEREPFTPSELGELGIELEKLERPKAEARKKTTQAKKGDKLRKNRSVNGGANLAPPLVGVNDPHLKNGKEKTGGTNLVPPKKQGKKKSEEEELNDELNKILINPFGGGQWSPPKQNGKKTSAIGAGNVSCTNSTGQTRDIVAGGLSTNGRKMSGRTYEKLKKVVLAVKENPELQPVLDDMNRTGNISKAYREIFQEAKKTVAKDSKFDAKAFTESQSVKVRKVFAKCPPEGVKLVKGILTSLSREDHETWLHK